MKLNLGWLNELVDISDISIKDLVETLSLYSVEVEEFKKIIDIDNLVIGRVMIRRDHPNSDHLSICTVNAGKEMLEIVCGAPNVQAGMDVIVAKIGAELPGGLKIKKAKIRGIESFGMICSLQELGIEPKYIDKKYQNGIFYFEEKVTPGEDPLKVLGLNHFVLDLSITPNRADLLSMIGLAYEISAIFNRPLKLPNFHTQNSGVPNSSDLVSVENKTNKCLTYYAKVFSDVKIKSSPSWLTSRLIAFGIRPINNVVDITNYILALFGQPLHAFDYDLLGNQIVVCQANDNEEIITLDEQKRVLTSDDIVITNGKEPVAIAGVMGGLNTEVTEKTTRIVLEAAVFDPVSVRKTSSRLNLQSESSLRFSRGVDINQTELALEYATYLLEELAEAKAHPGSAFVGIKHVPDKEIVISEKQVNKLLGTNISTSEIVNILERLQFKCVLKDDEIYVYVPNRRLDINIKEDLIEEIIRIYGYNKLPITLPESNMQGLFNQRQQYLRAIRNTLSTLGVSEVINYTLLNEQKAQEFRILVNENAKGISLIMPLSEERKTIRRSLMPNLIETVKYNYARKNKNLALFEIGNIYYYLDNQLCEEQLLAGAFSHQYRFSWDGNVETFDFYTVKGILNEVFKRLNSEVTYHPLEDKYPELHPNKSAIIKLNGNTIGYLGYLHPQYLQKNDLDDVIVFEVKLDQLLSNPPKVNKFKTLPRYLDIERDLAIVVNKEVMAQDIIDTILSSSKLVKNLQVFDIYTGEKIKDTEKSVAFKLFFNSENALTDSEINNAIERIIKNLAEKHQAYLRAN